MSFSDDSVSDVSLDSFSSEPENSTTENSSSDADGKISQDTDEESLYTPQNEEEDDDGDLGGIAYPSSEDETTNNLSSFIITENDVRSWEKSINASSHLPIKDSISLIKKILFNWNNLIYTQFASDNQELTKGSTLKKKKREHKTSIETEDAEFSLYSLVFENIFSNVLWSKLCGSGASVRIQDAHSKVEVVKLKKSIKAVLISLCLVFKYSPTGSWMQNLIMTQSLEKMLPLLLLFPIAFSQLLKVLISKIWIAPSLLLGENSLQDNGKPTNQTELLQKATQQFLTFTCRYCTSLASSVILKTAYMSWVKSLFDMSIHKHSRSTTLMNWLCELFFSMSDSQKQYDFAFLSLRALALSVRSDLISCSSKKKTAIIAQGGLTGIASNSWAFIYAIRLWSRIIGASSSYVEEKDDAKTHLKILKYPLVQIIAAGVSSSGKGIREAPYQLHLLECVISLLQVGIGFPLEHLTRIIKDTISTIKQQRKKEQLPADPSLLDWKTLLKVPMDCLSSSWYLELLGKRAIYLFAKCALLYSTRADFPEMINLSLRWVSYFLIYLLFRFVLG